MPAFLYPRSSRRSLMRDSDGMTTVEFAIVSPILMMLMMGIVEVSLIMHAQSVMEGAAFDASRRGKTGFIADGATREQTILTVLNQRAGTLFDTNRINISSVAYNQFDQIGQPEPFTDANGNGQRDPGENYTDVNGNGQYDTDMGAAGAGNASQVVVYTLSYPWQVFTPIMRPIADANGDFIVSARAVIQNEPF